MNNLREEQMLMRLRQMQERGRKKPRKRRSLQLKSDLIEEMQLRMKCAERWLTVDMSIATIVDETGRPAWWAHDWIKAGCPLFDFPKGKQLPFSSL